ncbi:MAG TPA: CoB--CoM heterodisulfide reductase iron-sulfur subunit A family protein [Bacteroidales bacterium]|nr:CoB--CoM heterodisulfide reductase iron-sulfur subunit A family protein [Bacteroidales bacterium]HSA44307.1 CoB--CoM heterodisulfide reductase iron-sulfur subunit A family protein [Bacteroidales bacterium]
MRTGIFFCQVDENTLINTDAVAKYAANLQGVELVRILGLRPRLDAENLSTLIQSKALDRIIIAGDMPGYYKPVFTKAMAQAGGDPAEVRLASFREHGAQGEQALDRAKATVACASMAVPFSLVATPRRNPVHHATLVIGGGIAGIQASLEIANAGKHVYLVEQTGTIGGHMAMFDKTFPTLDCAACILTPKMVSVGQHDMIHLLTNSKVTEVSGKPGAYRVKIRQRARRVDVNACVACNLCSEVCPVKVESAFDSGISLRKAIYIPFPQAVPNAYLIDEESCTYVLSEGQKCGVCVKKCPKECINLDEPDTDTDLEVGNIIIATGYELLDVGKIEQYGYGKYPNVLTSLEFERLTNASGTTGGRIVTKTKQFNKKTQKDEWIFSKDGVPPRSVAIIHCVGSRNKKYNAYCSRVCCMYSLKFAHLIREKIPNVKCYEFYIDMRAFGKGYEEFAERIRHEGTFVVRGHTTKVEMKHEQMSVRGEDIMNDRIVEFPVDMVVLAVGLVPSAETENLSRILGISRDPDGWFSELDYNGNPTDTERGGIYVAGMCQGPKDIPDTVAQASAVAAGVLRSITSGRGIGHMDSVPLSEIEARAKILQTI